MTLSSSSAFSNYCSRLNIRRPDDSCEFIFSFKRCNLRTSWTITTIQPVIMKLQAPVFNSRPTLKHVAFLRIVKAIFTLAVVFKVIDLKSDSNEQNHTQYIFVIVAFLILFFNVSFFPFFIIFLTILFRERLRYFHSSNESRKRNERQRKCNPLDASKTLNYCPIISCYPFAITSCMETERYQARNFERVNSSRRSSNCFCF